MRIADLVRLLSGVLICLSCSPSILESQTTNLSSIGPPVGASAGHKRSETDIPRSVLGNLPLQFEENKGQAEGDTRFLARGLGYTLLLNPDGLELNLRQKGNRPTRHLSMHLLGAQASNLLGRDLTATQTNYYLGRDPRNWHLGVRSYRSVVNEGAYKGIDLIYHGSGSQLEYDFVIAPGSDPAQIRMRFDGLKPLLQGKDLSFEAEDKLSVRTLKAFQILDGIKKPVDAEWEIVGDQASIHLGPYDHGHELIIDPVFFYGSYIAGTGADDAVSIVQGAQQGQFYVALSTSSMKIEQPATVLNPNCSADPCGGTDTLILEIQATTTDIPVWIAPTTTDPTDWEPAPQDQSAAPPVYPSVLSASYLGGNAGDTKPTSMVADKAFNLYVTGSTTNPGGLPQLGSPICTVNCTGYVAKLSSNLTLTYSLALAAIGSGISVDAAGNDYITGTATAGTIPQSDITFEKLLTSGSALVSGNHAYLMELGPTGALLFSSFIGGSGVDGGKAVAVSGTGDTVYVTGSTTSTDFPTKCSVCQTTFGGGSGDAFVLAISHLPAAPVLEYSTYLGGSGDDSSSSIAVDVAGNVVLVGSTASTNFPNTPPPPAVRQTFQFTQLDISGKITAPVTLPNSVPPGGSQDGFVTSLSANGTLRFTDFLGGSNSTVSTTSANAIVLDQVGVIYVTGTSNANLFTEGTDSHTDFLSGDMTFHDGDKKLGPATTDNWKDQSFPNLSNNHVFFAQIDPSGQNLLQATIAGGGGDDQGKSLSVAGYCFSQQPNKPFSYPPCVGTASIVGSAVETTQDEGLFGTAAVTFLYPLNPPPPLPAKVPPSATSGFFVQEELAGYCNMQLQQQGGSSVTLGGPCVSGTTNGKVNVTDKNGKVTTVNIPISGISSLSPSGAVTLDLGLSGIQPFTLTFSFLPLGAIGAVGDCQLDDNDIVLGCPIIQTGGGGAGTIFNVTYGTLTVVVSCSVNCTGLSNTVLIGQPVTLNAVVTNGFPNTVKWSSSGGTFSSSDPSTSVTFIPGGTGGPIVVTATPVADPSFSPATITLNTLVPTNVSFPDAGPFVSGQTNIPVNVSASTGSASVPNGDVTYQVVGGPSGSSTLNNGATSIQLASLPVGTYNLVVNYPGNPASYLVKSSNTLTFTVNPAPPNVTLTLSASSIFFGNIVQGTPSGTQSITLTNSGANTISGLTLKLGGANASEFALTSATTCGASLTANLSCSVAATFTPASLGTRSAVLLISYTGTGSPQVVNLGGIGASPLSVTSNATQFVAGTTFQFTSSSPATWTASAGTITSAGFFTAPNPVTTPTPITVTATSQSNAQIIATTQITVVPSPAIVVPSTNTLPAGGSVNIPMSISAGTGIAGEAMTFACSPKTLPTGVTCIFTPNPVVNAGGATVTLQLFSNTARNNLPTRDFPWRRSPLDGYTVIAVGCILVFRRKKYSGRMMMVLAVAVGSAALLSLSACGTSGSFNGTTQGGHVITGTYTIDISVSGASPGSADYNQTLTTVPLKVVIQ